MSTASPFLSCTIADGSTLSSRATTRPATFDDAYRDCFAFVFRSARRLGVHEVNLDDVVQEVFLVVHRRLPDYDARLPIRAWIYGILSRVVRDHRRNLRRREQPVQHGVDPSSAIARAPSALEPERQAEQREGWRLLSQLLDRLDDDKREVLVLSELEQMTVPEIAGALGANLNTTYSRLKAAKKAFGEVYAREMARASRRGPA